MTYDLIIVAQSKDGLIEMTQNCIDSARQDGADMNVIVVETGDPYRYDVDKIIEYNDEFNYNRALNMGLKYAVGDVHILANNDIIFHPGWSQIGELMSLNGFHSASALSQSCRGFVVEDKVYPGYDIGTTLTGWCIFMDRYCREQIGDLDESCSFWYSDNLYALQLQEAGIEHGLFCNIQVDHITSRTLAQQTSRLQRRLQIGELGKYINRKRYYAKREKLTRVNT